MAHAMTISYKTTFEVIGRIEQMPLGMRLTRKKQNVRGFVILISELYQASLITKNEEKYFECTLDEIQVKAHRYALVHNSLNPGNAEQKLVPGIRRISLN